MLGPLVVDGEDGRLGQRDRVVLAALAVRPGEVVPPERLADALWGATPPQTWTKVVQGCVVRLRKVLGAGAIETTYRGYRLVVSGDDIDSQRFERLLGRGRELLTLAEPERAAYVLDEAMALWRGPALSDLDGWDVGRIEAARLDELRRDAEELRVDAALRSGHSREVLGEAQTLVAQAPLRERRWALLALAQYQAGQQSQALRTLRQVRTVLATELALDPGPDLVALEQAILRQDPSLVVEALRQPSAACPYQGLPAYDVGDADTYFGREDEVAECRGRLTVGGVLVVVGPSGSGKSSLVRAGVAASLERDGHRVVLVTPGAHPMDALTAVPARGRTPVLVVDQCEEAVTLCQDPAVRAQFFERLAQHAAHAPLVVALRADRIGELSAHPAFARLVERGLFLLGAMGSDQLRECIEGPAHQAGLLLEPGLVDLLVREVEGEPGALPLLSHALRETWSQREGRTLTVAGYHATGGIRGAVARSAEEVYERVGAEQQRMVRDLMLRLVLPAPEGESVRSRTPRRLVATDQSHERVIEMLVTSRLVTSDDGVLELAHEALARAWPRLQQWLRDDTEGQRILRHLSAAADAWESMGRPPSELYRGVRLAEAVDWHGRVGPDITPLERSFLTASQEQVDADLTAARQRADQETRSRRRTRRLAVGLAIALVLAVVAAVGATGFQRTAEDRAADARAASTVADANRLAALSKSVGSLDLSLLLAAESTQMADTPSTRDSLLASLVEHRRATQVVPLAGRPWDGELADRGRALYVALTDRVVRWQVGSTAPPRQVLDWLTPGDIATSATRDLVAVSGWKDDRTMQVGVFDGNGRSRLLLVGLHEIGGWPLALGFSADGSRLLELVGVRDAHGPSLVAVEREVAVRTGRLVARHRALRSPTAGVYPTGSFADDGSTLVSWTDEPHPRAALSDLDRGTRLPLQVPTRTPASLGFVALPTGAAQRWADGTVTLYDRHGRRTQDLDAHRAPVRDVVVAPDRSWAATADDRGQVLVWNVDPATGHWSQREPLLGHDGSVSGVAVGSRGRTLVTVSEDGTAISWDLSADAGFGSPVAGLGDRWVSNRPVVVSPGRVVVAPTRPAPSSPETFGQHGSGTLGVAAAFLDPATGHLLDLVPVGRTIEDVAFGSSVSVSPDRSKVAVTYATGTAVLDAHTHDVLARIVLPRTGERAPDGTRRPELVWATGWTPDGSRLLLGADGKDFNDSDANLVVVDAATWRPEARRVPVHGAGVQTIETSPGGRWLAAGGSNPTVGAPGTVSILDADTLKVKRVLRLGRGDYPYDVSFSPDSRLVAAGGDLGVLSIFDVASGRLLHQPVKVHDGFVQQVEWLPDGRTVVTTGADGMTSLYDVQRGLLQASMPGSSDGAPGYTYLIAATSHQVTALTGERPGRSYPLDAARWLDYACVVAGRDLTPDEWARYLPNRPYRRTCGDRA